jgi:DNA invertase Pin-like site-specific DNA recombinase
LRPNSQPLNTDVYGQDSVLKLGFKIKVSFTHTPTIFKKGNSMLIGYARVSTSEQSLDLQVDALKGAGCGRIFQDTASGSIDQRKGLLEALTFAREGDQVTVWKLDRLGRSLRHLVETVNDLNSRGVGFKSLQESLDSSTPGGKLVFHIFAALAEFERDIIRSRTHAGLEAARLRGRVGGRPVKLNESQLSMARTLMADKRLPVSEVCRTLQVSKATLYRALAK